MLVVGQSLGAAYDETLGVGRATSRLLVRLRGVEGLSHRARLVVEQPPEAAYDETTAAGGTTGWRVWSCDESLTRSPARSRRAQPPSSFGRRAAAGGGVRRDDWGGAFGRATSRLLVRLRGVEGLSHRARLVVEQPPEAAYDETTAAGGRRDRVLKPIPYSERIQPPTRPAITPYSAGGNPLLGAR